MFPEDMKLENPPTPFGNRTGKKPTLLTDVKVKVLLSMPGQWFNIGTRDKWISGVKANIESMTQANISHLKDKGKFEIQQRKNNEGKVDIYCRFIQKSSDEEE
jgi:hypothetical protein